MKTSKTSGFLAGNSDDFVQLENQLRPKSLKEYIGQDGIVNNLNIALMAAKKRGDTLDHVLLHGPPGLGKTTLAYIVANEMGVGIKVTSGPALEKQGDVAAIISNLKENDILFIDEIHRLKPAVEEVLYAAMEDYALDIVIGKGSSARIMRINLPKFTLVGATTKLSLLSSPLRGRFGNIYKFQFYNDEHIKKIILRSAGILNCDILPQIAELLAKSCRHTPRIANRLIKRVRDYADVHHDSRIDQKSVNAALDILGVDSIGLDEMDKEILSVIINKFNGGPVGLNTISAATSEEKETIEEIYEPFLIKLGFLERTPKGRIATQRAYEHLGIEFLKNN